MSDEPTIHTVIRFPSRNISFHWHGKQYVSMHVEWENGLWEELEGFTMEEPTESADVVAARCVAWLRQLDDLDKE